MTNEQDVAYLRHLGDAIHQIQDYVREVSEAEFVNDEMLQDAVIRQLSIIGEAVGQLSDELREKSPSVPWTDIYGMRNKLVHDYFGVDLGAVWDTVKRDRSSRLDSVERLIEKLEDT